MAQTYLTKTFSSSGNLDVWTVSFWVKKSLIETGSDQYVMHAQTDADNQTGIVLRGSGDNYQLQCFNAVSASANNGFNVYTSRYFRDASAWYHIVVACDTTESSGSNGLKIYVNGAQQSVTVGAWNQNGDTQFSKNQQHVVGAKTGNSLGFSGYLSQFIFANGTQYAASTFGSTNANGIWVPNTAPSVTYGTNGFKLDFTGTGTSADSSGFGADSSGNNNHFASNNLGTNPNTKDGPQNNFSTMNPLNIFPNTTPIITDGALKTQSQSTSGAGLCSTIAVSAGKWYAEGKIGTGATLEVGAVDIGTNAFNKGGTSTNSVGYDYGGNIRVNNSNTQTSLSTYTGGDIVGIALNMDTATGTVTFYKNGSAVGSAQNFTTSKPNAAAFYMQSHTSSGNQSVEWNYGNPTFAISSSNADANGEGSFEYAVPSGYYALCTNNLALYGG